MAQATGWSHDQVAGLRTGEFETYLDFALRSRGIDPDKVSTCPPPTDDDDPGIDATTLLHLPESILMSYPPIVFSRLTPAERASLPAAVRARLEG